MFEMLSIYEYYKTFGRFGGIGKGKRASRQRGEGKILMMCINVHHIASYCIKGL